MGKRQDILEPVEVARRDVRAFQDEATKSGLMETLSVVEESGSFVASASNEGGDEWAP
jgi:hypothetical protein